MAGPLYARHFPGLAATYAEVENHALHQTEILVGTPGSISVRENSSGSKFYVRQYYDYQGAKKDQYITGHFGTAESERRAQDWKGRLEEAREVLKLVRLLAREGYCALPPKHLAALAPLTRHRIFDAGAVLVGTHAFEVVVNRLGIRVAVFATEDVDIARPGKLAIRKLPKGGLLDLLRESGIDFVDVPQLRHRDPPTSFKEKGRSRFTFDLLVPASGSEIGTHSVPELNAHVTALPFLKYLVTETQTGAAISSHGVAAVRVPVPERFAVHKLIVAQLRTGRPEKTQKDLKQAAALIAALGEIHPGALASAFEKTPTSSRKHIRKSLLQARPQLEAHPQAWEEIATAARL
ncbi:MAG: GSU2403 family nucleotidyltransferase fold protein [Usitatibacter sp.]